MNNPYEEIYQTVMKLSEELGYATFDYLPDASQSYPFVFGGEQVNDDLQTKDRTLGTTLVTIHVYAEQNRRSEVAGMLERLLRAISDCHKTEHFGYVVTHSDSRLIGEVADSLPLWHGVLDLQISYD